MTTNTNTIDILSIHIKVNGFSFYYFEKDHVLVTKKLYIIDPNTLEDYNEQLLNQLKTINTSKFKTIRLVFSNSLFTIIPNELYNEDRASDYMEFNSFLLPNDPIESKLINTLDIQFLFSYNESIELLIKNNFSKHNVKLSHSGYSLINQLKEYNSYANLFIWINTSNIEIVHFKNNKLIFYNYFETETKEDVLYYILFISQQLDIDLNKEKIHLLGNIENKSDVIKMMKKYIRYLKIGINENLTFKEFII